MSHLLPSPRLCLVAFGLLFTSACGNSLYAPCASNVDCGGGDLQCVQLGEPYGAMCTRPCTISRSRSGLPDAIDEDQYFENGASHADTVTDSACADQPVEVTTQDGNMEYTSDGIVGVCRLSPETAALGVSGNSPLQGICTPPL